MKKTFLTIALLFTLSQASLATIDCNSLPKEGPFERRLTLIDNTGRYYEGVFRADIEKSEIQQNGHATMQHNFNKPSFTLPDGSTARLTRKNLEAIAQKIGYERVEFVYLMSITRRDGSEIAVVDPQHSASFYHHLCAAWQY